MPLLRLFTSLARKSIPESFPLILCKTVADTLGKPLARCDVAIIPDCIMTLGGVSSQPQAQVYLTSIGSQSEVENAKHCSKLSTLVSENLKIPLGCIGIQFTEVKSHEVGRGGKIYTKIIAETPPSGVMSKFVC
ncbi:Macrophage migration inhibitory factor [Oopsacas minuta]|uniref:L-dopachrome isomerase n=1 Tax=Oopsacas minuta TaxID=111878 RepID=A0AAV7JTC5_9METZ|nr:Macrophage migration inhibitory factor [Oopsacas minuta]